MGTQFKVICRRIRPRDTWIKAYMLYVMAIPNIQTLTLNFINSEKVEANLINSEKVETDFFNQFIMKNVSCVNLPYL